MIEFTNQLEQWSQGVFDSRPRMGEVECDACPVIDACRRRRHASTFE